jgi:hypothetical protein
MRGIARESWIGFAAVVAALAIGCGSGDSEPAGGAAPAPPAATAPAAPTPPAPAPAAQTPEAVATVLGDLYEWDPASGPARDLATDVAECQTQATGQGLSGVAQHIQCMQGKGWKTRQPAS